MCHTRDKNEDRRRNSQQHVLYTWSLTKSQGNLRHPTSSSSSTQWEQHDDGKSNKSWILGDPHPGLNSCFFFVQRGLFFRLPEGELPAGGLILNPLRKSTISWRAWRFFWTTSFHIFTMSSSICVAEDRAFSLSNDTELAVVSMESRARNEWKCLAQDGENAGRYFMGNDN